MGILIMTTQHTKGQWKIAKNDPKIVYVSGTDNDTVVCVSESSNGINEAIANARLIAAAPKLLAVCECEAALEIRHTEKGYEILESYGWDRSNRFELSATEFVANMRTAAIAAAKGE